MVWWFCCVKEIPCQICCHVSIIYCGAHRGGDSYYVNRRQGQIINHSYCMYSIRYGYTYVLEKESGESIAPFVLCSGYLYCTCSRFPRIDLPIVVYSPRYITLQAVKPNIHPTNRQPFHLSRSQICMQTRQ